MSGSEQSDVSYGDFFRHAPAMNPNRTLITGKVCGVQVEEIEDPLMREIRYLDKLVDELAKGKTDGKDFETVKSVFVARQATKQKSNPLSYDCKQQHRIGDLLMKTKFDGIGIHPGPERSMQGWRMTPSEDFVPCWKKQKEEAGEAFGLHSSF